MQVIIIGAGPAGLYTAIKLKKQGVTDLLVLDPRAGIYTRPGYMTAATLDQAQQGIGINFWQGNQDGHIKNLERGLYTQALELGIKIEKKRFIDLQQDSQTPGIKAVDEKGNQEFIPAQYVLDCTGLKREVIHALNRLIPDSPLQLTTIIEPPVKTNFIAYVKISPANWDHFKGCQSLFEPDHSSIPGWLPPQEYMESILKLRALGWYELKIPRCYGTSFGKDKVCLYLYAPDSLEEKDYDRWVRTVLQSYHPLVDFEHLPPSKKYAHKPRFGTFPSHFDLLNQVVYKDENLPTIIPLGDAQIGFDYYLGHGIREGLSRIDTLFKHLEFYNGEITSFHADRYQTDMCKAFESHKQKIIKQANKVQQGFDAILDDADEKMRQASLVSNEAKRKEIQVIRKEIQTRMRYINAIHNFTELPKTRSETTPASDLSSKLAEIEKDLLYVLKELPEVFGKERQKARDVLNAIPDRKKEYGIGEVSHLGIPRLCSVIATLGTFAIPKKRKLPEIPTPNLSYPTNK